MKGVNVIIDFLKTDRSKGELATALEVIREFKKCESQQEWFHIPLAAWSKLEQLQEFLEHLTEGKELAQDTKRQIERVFTEETGGDA